MRCRPLLALLCSLAAATASASGTLVWTGAARNGADGIEGLGRPNDVALSPDGRFLYAAGTADDSILRFARDPATGALAFLDRVVGDGATPPGDVPGLDLPRALAVSPDGAHLYVAGGTNEAGTSGVIWFDRDVTTGALFYRGSLTDGSGPGLYALDRPHDVLVSGDGENVYVTAFEARAVTVFARDPGTGDLSVLQVVEDDANGVDGLEGIQRLAESPDGDSLYVASASRQVTVPGVGGVATFARAADGTLTFLEVEQQGVAGVDGLGAPRDVAVSPDGAHVYVAAGGTTGGAPPVAAAIARFDRAPDGRLAFAGAIPEAAFGAGEPRSVAVSPDGGRVYAITYGRSTGSTANTPGKLAVFSRDPLTGALSLIDRFDEGADGVTGLAGGLRVRVSPGGDDVYVAGEFAPSATSTPGAVAIFARAPEGPACGNGIDDDGDGDVDFPADTQCSDAADPSEKPDCRNGLDDDGDGFADHPSDLECTSAADASERIDCTNGLDDDGDGSVDAADPGCANPAAPGRENPQCDDGRDNDGDDRIDWDGGSAGGTPDPQCVGSPARNKETACGLGAELALLLPLLASRRGARRAQTQSRAGRKSV